MLKKLFCNHNNAVYPVSDNHGFVVGNVCDKCGKFWIRTNIPNYDERQKKFFNDKKIAEHFEKKEQ